jgi:DNA-binding transcriptional regulator GbsR (MarR family)
VRIETLLEETFKPKLEEISQAVQRLERANEDPDSTHAGREMARRIDEAKQQATDAKKVADEVCNRQDKLESSMAATLRVLRWGMAILVLVSVLLIIANNSASLLHWLGVI